MYISREELGEIMCNFWIFGAPTQKYENAGKRYYSTPSKFPMCLGMLK